MHDRTTVVFHDTVVDQISEQVAAFPPEKGGLLIGPPDVPVISDFLVDSAARATGITFQLSRESEHRLHAYEKAGHQLKGVLHSHPSGMPHPSGGDGRTFTAQLSRMPWLPYLITPIVTHTQGPVQDHQISLPGRGVMSVFVTTRDHSERVRISPSAVSVLLTQHVLAGLTDWGASCRTGNPSYISVGGQQYACFGLRLPGGSEGTLMLPPGYPMTAPILLDEGEHIPLIWDLGVPDADRLTAALEASSQRVEEFGGRRPSPKPRADLPDIDAVRAGLRARLDGSVAPSVANQRVLVVGLGSGGSQTTDALVRASVEDLIVIDPDDVEFANLSRSVYTAGDVGTAKVEAISRHAASINPGVRITGHAKSLNEFTPEELGDLVGSVDLVVAATDDPEAQYRLNRVAYQAGKRAVFAGVYGKGTAGEVVFTVPGITACFRCATGGKRGGSRGAGLINYGTGTLVAEPALGADIAHVVSASVKIIIGLLELTDPRAQDHSSAHLVASALGKQVNFLQIAMVPDYEGFGDVFRAVPGQHSYQSIWIGTRTDPSCPVCGDHPIPDSLPDAVDVAEVAAALAASGEGVGIETEFVDFEGAFAVVLEERNSVVFTDEDWG